MTRPKRLNAFGSTTHLIDDNRLLSGPSAYTMPLADSISAQARAFRTVGRSQSQLFLRGLDPNLWRDVSFSLHGCVVEFCVLGSCLYGSFNQCDSWWRFVSMLPPSYKAEAPALGLLMFTLSLTGSKKQSKTLRACNPPYLALPG